MGSDGPSPDSHSAASRGCKPERLTIRLDDGLVAELEKTFCCKARASVRLAVRLGVTALAPGEVKVMGSLGIRRLLATIGPFEIQDEKAQEALLELTRDLEKAKASRG